MMNQLAFERENKNKGMRISIILHALLLLIAFLYMLPQVDREALEDKPPYAVKVDFSFEESSMSKFAHEDVGVRRPKAEAVQQIEATKTQELEVQKPEIKVPEPVFTPTPEPVISETVEEEAPVKVADVRPTEPAKPEPVKETPKPEPVKEPAKTTSTSTPSTTSTTGSGSSTTKPSTVEGKDGGTGKGDTGTGAGNSKGNDGDSGLGNSSDGTGAYDGSGDGIFGRKVIYRDVAAAKAAVNMSGTVAIKVCVNRAGIVTYGEIIPGETTIKSRETLKKFMAAARGSFKVESLNFCWTKT